jgi:hypothetical protein
MLFSPVHFLLIPGAQLFLLNVGLNKLYESGVKVMPISLYSYDNEPFDFHWRTILHFFII